MTPKEKAKDLLIKLMDEMPCNDDPPYVRGKAKQCALIAVDEAMGACSYIESAPWVPEAQAHEYWQQVKEEIEKI